MRRTGLLLALLLGGAGLAQDDEELDPAVALRAVETAHFFTDRQEGLARYEAQLVRWQGMVARGASAEPGPDDGKPLGKLTWNAAAGERRLALEKGQTLAPSCGPWRLDTVTSFLLDLFARPWSETFPDETWIHEAEAIEGGTRLTLTPDVDVGEADFLRPAIKAAAFDLDARGVVKRGVLSFDQRIGRTESELSFVFDDHAGKKRIRKISFRLRSANMEVRPSYEFRYAKAGGFFLPERVEFRVAGEQVSKTFSGKDLVTVFLFRKVAAERAAR